ncbi:bacteriohopanetetrol glucosamine biosynthesis glycosyltransferase HpnI [Novosphingobium sp. NDB2Meth1]|uniref:bacteriohopanetetrol glucosamine biosynthesis glycosyltransferase HpnI n=1 Tax=Novosphingobium sp. NDB2Meth1 TaxID=1892847 RepID=UPI000931665B|nr:bacteriohopanetetrol glucosamine biosynthesis glycosyltransferase HpnI [Novosphingobium sp. NDB2Meth1]
MTAGALLLSLIGWLVLALAAIGTLYWAIATWALARFLRRERPAAARSEAVTLLKPLYGAEPQLEANLASFLRQTHQGPVQMVCGVQREDDPAAETVRAMQARHPTARIDLVIDSTRHGANVKIGNLINMMARAEHDIVVLSDSDMAVEPSYLAQVLAALDRPGIGAVTCLYHGRGDAGFWSRLAAAGPSYQFLVGLVFGKVMGLAEPCMGSTIALRRSTLEAIGGFEAFADVLADDHAIGAAVRAHGLGIAIPPVLLAHASAETSLAQVWRQELRWAATIRALQPGGYAGSVIGFPLALAMLGSLVHPLPGLYVVAAASAARLYTKRVVDRHAGTSTAPFWLLPVRDGLSLAVFVASYFVRVVDWRGTRLRMEHEGQIIRPVENTRS